MRAEEEHLKDSPIVWEGPNGIKSIELSKEDCKVIIEALEHEFINQNKKEEWNRILNLIIKVAKDEE